MDLIGSNWSKLDQNGSNWIKLDQIGLNLIQIDQTCWNPYNFTMKFKKVYIPCVYFFGIQIISPWNSKKYTSHLYTFLEFKWFHHEIQKNIFHLYTFLEFCILFWNSVYFFEFHGEIILGISKDTHLLEFTSSPASLEFKSSFNFDRLVWKGTFG